VVHHLIDLAGGDTTGLASVLASHYERAEDWASAAGALILAADRAAETGAVEAGLELLGRAVAAADRAGDDAQASAAAQRRAGLGFITGRFEIAGAEWNRLEGMAGARGDDALRAIALAQLGVIAAFAHDREVADSSTAKAVELLEGVQDPDAIATAIGARFWFAIISGHLDELDELRQAFERRALGASVEAQATWRTTQSLHSRWTGSFDQTLALTEHATPAPYAQGAARRPSPGRAGSGSWRSSRRDGSRTRSNSDYESSVTPSNSARCCGVPGS
jgi:hypothetical protein